ncbi:MAG: hypothetical protein AB1815_02605 [Bacillota bacterium]
MQLVNRAPLTVPINRNDKWFDDFAVTGGANPGYTITGGVRDKLPTGILLRATTSTTVSFNLPAAYRFNSMELEVAVRLIAGSRA